MDKIIIKGTQRNEINLWGQSFRDASIKAEWCHFYNCSFLDCEYDGEHLGFTECNGNLIHSSASNVRNEK